MTNKFPFIYLLFASLLIFSSGLSAQDRGFESLLEKGDSLRSSYCFEESLRVYGEALDSARDSLQRIEANDRILLSENGKSMSDVVYIPSVLARHRFSITDFYLYYPLPDRSWRRTPNQLDSTVHRFTTALYAPDESTTIYFSAEDQDGFRNLYHTSFKDSLWMLPSLLNEHVTSASNEIFPMVSSDGNRMYFASEGLYGVGGFDIYVSEWDSEVNDWSVPENMGFPFSSPADDFLFVDTDEGNMIFASNRNCCEDSVWVYVLEPDNLPVRKAVDNPEDLLKISELLPAEGDKKDVRGRSSESENIDIRRYLKQMYVVKAYRDSVEHYVSVLDEDIAGNSQSLKAFQDSLAKASGELQKIELEFLFSGVVIDPEKLQKEADQEVICDNAEYVFRKMQYGDDLKMSVERPEPTFDYSFMILDEGRFAEDNTLPSGIVYQIQIFSVASKARIRDLKGLSPVFEEHTQKGRYVYRVGLFRSYSDVLSNLNKVKRRGFKSAFIVAFKDGKSVSVSYARSQEGKPVDEFFELRIRPANGDMDESVSSGIRQQTSGKDIAKITEPDGGTAYLVGPFGRREDANRVSEFIKAMGVTDVVVRKMETVKR